MKGNENGKKGMMFMRLFKVVGVIVLLFTVLFTSLAVYANEPDANDKSVMASDTTSSDHNDKLLLDSSEHLSDKNIKNIMQEIDLQVKKTKNRLNFNFYEDYYDGDTIMFRHFNRDVETDSFTEYYLYYNEQGKLIYADITHYRAAAYSIYYYNDELLHVEVGPSYEGGVSINGDMADVKAAIKKDPEYAFVLEDHSFCLQHAYK